MYIMLNTPERCFSGYPRGFPVRATVYVVVGIVVGKLLSITTRRLLDQRLEPPQLKMEIKQAFDREGIEIPFHHRSIYSGSITEPFPVRIVEGAKTETKEL